MNRYAKALLALLLMWGLMAAPATNVLASAPDANKDLALIAVTPTVPSGNTAQLQLHYDIAGAHESVAQNIGDKAFLEIQLPENTDVYSLDADMSTLKVCGAVPTYDKAAKKLKYEIDKLQTGMTAFLSIPVNTINGTTPNDTKLSFTATLKNAKGEALVNSAPAVVTVKADYNETVTKRYIGVTNREATMPKAGDTVKWEIKGAVVLNQRGGLYIKPGSAITLSDTLPQGLEYVSSNVTVGSLGAGQAAGQTITWTGTAPTLEEQKALAEQGVDLYTCVVEVLTKVTLDPQTVTNLENKAAFTTTNITDSAVTKAAAASTTVLTSGSDITFQDGNWFPAVAHGPLNGSGAYGGTNGNPSNPNPDVVDTASLRMFEYFNIALNNSDILKKKEADGSWTTVPNAEWNVPKVFEEGYRQITTKQNFSDKLILEGILFWTPKSYYHSSFGPAPLGTYPETKVVFHLADGSTKEHIVKFDREGGAISYVMRSRTDMGLLPQDKVRSFDIIYKNADGSPLFGGVSLQTFPQFGVEPGTLGEVRWQTEYETVLKDGTTYLRTADENTDNIGFRQATVYKNAETTPIVYAGVEFVQKDGNLVTNGPNVVRHEFGAHYTSTRALNGDLSSVVLLPYGVKYKAGNDLFQIRSTRLLQIAEFTDVTGTIQVADENYKGTGQQLIRITWDKDRLLPGEGASIKFGVDITDQAPNVMGLLSYSASTNGLKLISSNPGRAPIQEDTDDINKDSLSAQQRIHAANTYTDLVSEDLQITKLVKGDLDTDYSKWGRVTPGGRIDYRISINNTTGRNIFLMSMMDVLPYVGDLGIVDNANRETAFNVRLTGPITLSEEWADKVNVYYSTVEHPSRQDMYNMVTYIAGDFHYADPAGAAAPNWTAAGAGWTAQDWEKVRSFKLELKRGMDWIPGQQVTLSFAAKAPELTDSTNLPNPLVAFNTYDEAERTDENVKRAAWNSVAGTANGLLPTEPERVGVVIVRGGAVRVKYFIKGTNTELDNPTGGPRVADGTDKGWYTVKEPGTPIGEKYDTTTEALQPKVLTKDGKSYVITPEKIRSDSDPMKGEVQKDTQYVIYEYQQAGGAVRVKYFIEGTNIELDNPSGGGRVADGTDKGWYTVKQEFSPLGEAYDSTTPAFQPKYLTKDGKTYELTPKKVRADSDPVTGKVEEDTQYIIYEYRQIGGAVRVKYFIEGTTVELDNPAAGNRVADGTDKGWYTVKEPGAPVGEDYDTVNETFQPKTLTKDGKTYEITPKKVRADSDPVTGEVEEDTQYVIYEYRQLGGAVRVKYFIEGTNIELDNPAAGNRVANGEDQGWYTVKEPGAPVGEDYDTVNETLQPKTLTRNGKTYVLTAKKVRGDSDPVTGKVEEDTQYVIYEYQLKEAPAPDPTEKPEPRGGAVRVKYFIEGSDEELDNPGAGERLTRGRDKGWYTVKRSGSSIGEGYDATTPDFMPKYLTKNGKTYRLTPKKVRGGYDPTTGVVTPNTQYIVFEYRLMSAPKTGDGTNTALLAAMTVVSMGSILLMRRKRLWTK